MLPQILTFEINDRDSKLINQKINTRCSFLSRIESFSPPNYNAPLIFVLLLMYESQ